MKKIVVISLVAVVLLAGATYVVVQRNHSKSVAAASAAVPGPVKSSSKVQAVAHVVPVRHSQLSFTTGGVVAEVLVKQGDVVKAGQVLARLGSDRQAAAVAQAEAGVEQARARLEDVAAGSRPEEIAAAQAAVDVARAALAKVKQPATAAEIAQAEAALARAQAALVTDQAAPHPSSQQLLVDRADLSAAQAQLSRLKQGATAADIAQAEANLRQAEANLALRQAGPRAGDMATARAGVAAAEPQVSSAKAALSDTEIRAPYDGTVAGIDLRVGEFVQPGTVVAQVADLSAWQMETEDLTELRVVSITTGAPVTIRFDAVPDLTLTGTVSLIKTVGEKKQGDVLYTALVKPDSMDPRIRWNMTANITFE